MQPFLSGVNGATNMQARCTPSMNATQPAGATAAAALRGGLQAHQQLHYVTRHRKYCLSCRCCAVDSANSSTSSSGRQRVCIIGAGAAGCTAAWSLSRYPEKFQVEVWEAGDRAGGHASTLQLPGGLIMNNCVLGGTYSGFPNTLALLQQLGWRPHHDNFPVIFSHMRDIPTTATAAAAAGAGATGASTGHTQPAEDPSTPVSASGAEQAAAGSRPGDPLSVLQAAAWGTGLPDSPLYAAHARDMRVFTAALRWLWHSQQLLLLLTMPLRLLCRLLWCSDAFWEQMVAPLGVIFFGTGCRMADCPVIILAGALFDDSKGPVALESDPRTLMKLNPLPFFTFPRLDCVYTAFTAAATATGNVTFRFKHPATAVGAAVGGTAHAHDVHRTTHTSATASDNSSAGGSSSSSSSGGVLVKDSQGTQHCFDAVIMACHSNTALQLLRNPSRLHKLALGEVEYYDQSTILHTDRVYMQKRHPLLLQYKIPAWHVQQLSASTYELVYQFQTVTLQQRSQHDQSVSAATAAATSAAQQAAVTSRHNSSSSPNNINSSSSSTSSSKQLASAPVAAAESSGALPDCIWQVALSGPQALQEIDPSKVLSVKTYQHPAHTVGHFLRTLAFMRQVQGRDSIYFAGGWSFVDAHEFSILSGLGAASRLGADYPWAQQHPQAAELYKAFMTTVHGKA